MRRAKELQATPPLIWERNSIFDLLPNEHSCVVGVTVNTMGASVSWGQWFSSQSTKATTGDSRMKMTQRLGSLLDIEGVEVTGIVMGLTLDLDGTDTVRNRGYTLLGVTKCWETALLSTPHPNFFLQHKRTTFFLTLLHL